METTKKKSILGYIAGTALTIGFAALTYYFGRNAYESMNIPIGNLDIGDPRLGIYVGGACLSSICSVLSGITTISGDFSFQRKPTKLEEKIG